jgi:hypothetical protein
LRFLEDVAKRYDSGGFFQYRVTGGWKVSRVGENDLVVQDIVAGKSPLLNVVGGSTG